MHAAGRPRRRSLAAVAALTATLLLTLGACRGTALSGHGDADASPLIASATASAQPTGTSSANGPTTQSMGSCAGGRIEMAYRPGDPSEGVLCVRPYTELTLVLLPRPGERWFAVHSGDDSHAHPAAFAAAPNGTAEVTIHCGPRGHAKLTAIALLLSGRETPALVLHLFILPLPHTSSHGFAVSPLPKVRAI
jgi:hypothetical protein